jgi:hypothetical protein
MPFLAWSTVLVLSLGLPSTLRARQSWQANAGQLEAAARLRSFAASPPTSPASLATIGRTTPDHRWTGLVIGAGLLGVTGAMLMHSLCEANEDCTRPTIGGLVLGALVGGVTGGLLGAQFPKHAP